MVPVRDGSEKYLFEVAFYRVSRDAYWDDASERVERRYEELTKGRALPISEDDEIGLRQGALFSERVHGWEYNEVVAWLRAIWDGPGPAVKTYLWWVSAPRYPMFEPRKRFARGFVPHPFTGGIPIYKAFECWFDDADTDNTIRAELRSRVVALAGRRGDLHGRHPDLSLFDSMAPHIRWREAIGL
jgi:hypothetical protein